MLARPIVGGEPVGRVRRLTPLGAAALHHRGFAGDVAAWALALAAARDDGVAVVGPEVPGWFEDALALGEHRQEIRQVFAPRALETDLTIYLVIA